MHRIFWLAVAVACVAGCSKKSETPAGPDPAAHRSSVAEMLAPTNESPATPPALSPNVQPGGNAATPGDSAAPPEIARRGPELVRVMKLAQKQALDTGHFPRSWDEMIAAKLITQPPTGKNGKPMAWKEFVKAMDQ